MSRRALVVDRQRWYERLGYQPRNGARALDAAADRGFRFLAMFAFPQAGKSFHAARHIEPELLRPDYHCWLVAPTYPMGSKEFGYIYTDFANTGVLKLATRKHFDVRSGHMSLEFPWGSFVRVVSADNPDSLRMEQLDSIILCEASALPSNVYERFLYSRVELRQGKVLIPTTPAGFNWVYDAFRVPSLTHLNFEYGPWEGIIRHRLGGTLNPRHDPLYWSAIVSAVEDFGEILEPGVHTPEAVERARRLLPRPAFAEQFGGDFATYSGLVYPYSPALHRRPRFDIPRSWTHVVGYDHGAGGASDPTAILVGSYSPDGTLYWWGEIYDQTQSTIQSRGQLLKTLLRDKQPAFIMTGRDSKQVVTELRQIGLVASCPVDWSVSARIVRTTELLGRRKWVILEGCCPNLEREIVQYAWDEKRPGEPRDGNDHCLEAAGYAALAPVFLPDAAETPDLFVEEPRAVREEWQPFRDRMRYLEQLEQRLSLAGILDDTPFDDEPAIGGRRFVG